MAEVYAGRFIHNGHNYNVLVMAENEDEARDLSYEKLKNGFEDVLKKEDIMILTKSEIIR